MDLTLTLWLLGGFSALALFAGWRGARPPDPHRGPRMIPWRFIMLLSAAAVMLLLTHLGSLGGAPRPGLGNP
ncbi:MAG: hypothetical protein KF910_05245 [Brevundimonas sp.]|uniref:hypothetical protein n=1 Tax=Brevundimonas sp. TaxID=1871086 RepID=UPI0025C43517|nr:hypothetical protein [Brevundimonas sp.]MBX3476989.1 hypothetical protein [Brevundimonas sp.]